MPKNGRVKIPEPVGIDEVKSDLATLRSDLSSLASGLASTGRQRVVGLANQAKQNADEAHAKLGECVSERPVTSLLLAAGVGALGMLMLRRNH